MLHAKTRLMKCPGKVIYTLLYAVHPKETEFDVSKYLFLCAIIIILFSYLTMRNYRNSCFWPSPYKARNYGRMNGKKEGKTLNNKTSLKINVFFSCFLLLTLLLPIRPFRLFPPTSFFFIFPPPTSYKWAEELLYFLYHPTSCCIYYYPISCAIFLKIKANREKKEIRNVILIFTHN